MTPPKLIFARHARDNMELRKITETEVRFIVERGVRSPEPADPGAALGFRCSGMVRGQWLTVVAAAEVDELIIVTVFW